MSAGVVVAGALTLWMGWVWLDPVMGIVGALVIARWSWSLMRDTAAVLLDTADPQLIQEITEQIEGPGDLATETVDVERDAPHAGIRDSCLQLGSNPLIGREARGMADPRATVHKCARDFDHRDAIHQGKGRGAVALMALEPCNFRRWPFHWAKA